MDKIFNFERAYRRLTLEHCPQDKDIELIEVLIKTQAHLCKLGLISTDELKCLKGMLWKAASVNELQAEQLHHRRNMEAAEQILLEKGPAEDRMNKALNIFGLRIKDVSKRKTQTMANLYRSIMKAKPYSSPDGKRLGFPSYAFTKQEAFDLTWKNDIEKKNKIIEFIRREFDEPSNESLVQKLRRAGVKNLPGN